LRRLFADATVKDPGDLAASRCDTTARSLGMHRRPLALRHRPRAAGLPRVAAWLTAGVGAINVISALTPGLSGRAALLAHLAPSGLVMAAHAAVLPVGLALLVLSVYLARRRRRALWLAVGLLAGVGGLELLKGLDVEEAAISWALAALLVWGQSAFTVHHENGTLTTALRRAGLAAAVAVAAATIGVVAASLWGAPTVSGGLVVRETLALLTLSAGPQKFTQGFAWLPLGVGLLSAGALVAAAWALFRPLCNPRNAPPDNERALVRGLLRRHGHDTLSAFKLREDLQTLFADDRQAFLSYRIKHGVLLVSGDPVGPDTALPGLIRSLTDFTAERGLRIGAVGASEAFSSLAHDAGLHALYLGDEAIVATTGFSLEGRPIKKVRQAVNRLERSGFSAELRRLGSLTETERRELEAVSRRWRAGAPERGFSMAMDGLGGEGLADSAVVVCRDEDGRIRGFLHFVPAYGRPTMSLSAMRRDRDTPNGLTDFLVVRSIQLLGEQGVEELSLNFAAFARWLHSPTGRIEPLLARVVRRGDRHFQIESLYSFNAKFFPRWQPRYLLHEGVSALPRTALAAMDVEGHLPRPALLTRLRRLARSGTAQAPALLRT
jgi:lysyl-tRNA synthetase class 2